MLAFSSKWIWLPLYGFLAYRLYRSYSGNILWLVVAAGVMILLTDQGSVQLFKETFQRLRPCHEPELQHLVNLVAGSCGGPFGFVSSHAANVFGLATFFRVVVPEVKGWGLLLFAWAICVSLSRVYIGVHYPGDVIVGAVFGLAVGFSVGRVASKATTE